MIIAVEMKDGTEAAHQARRRGGARASGSRTATSPRSRCSRRCSPSAGLPAARLEDAHSQAAHERYETDTQQAIEAGVFGAPSYVIEGEIFWGQDRLDFVQRRLARAGA